MRLHDLTARIIRHADHRAFQHVRVRQQRRLNLGARDVISRRNDHIIGPRRKMEPARIVLPKTIPGQVPAALHIVCLPPVIEIPAPRRPPHRQAPHLAAWQLLHGVANNPRLIAPNRAARAGGRMIFKPVGQKDVQHFGGPDAVQHRLAGFGDPLVIDRRGQGFSGADRGTKR